MKITATRETKNPAWTKTLMIELVSTTNGYWWKGVRADGETDKDAVMDAETLRPGADRKTGYTSMDSACNQAERDGWTVNRPSAYSTIKLADLGYGDVTAKGDTIDLTDAEVIALANSVGGTVDEIETARI